jgi:hypothetical protein
MACLPGRRAGRGPLRRALAFLVAAMLAAAPAGPQQITGSLSSGEFDGNDPAWRRFAQTTSAPTTAGTTATEHEDSASELNRKLTNPVSDIWSLQNQFNNFKLEEFQGRMPCQPCGNPDETPAALPATLLPPVLPQHRVDLPLHGLQVEGGRILHRRILERRAAIS